MILSKSVKLKINNRQVKYYKNLGYEKIKGGKEIKIKVVDLTQNSNVMIEISCDKCGKKTIQQYNNYNKTTKNQTQNYYCTKCVKSEKTKFTNLEKYGVENVFQSEEIKKKRKDTMIERYDNEHALNVFEFKEKLKQTNNERFGCDYASQNEKIKQKIEETFLHNYGVKTSLIDPTTINKIKATNLEKFGVENVFKLRLFKEDRMLDKYGIEYPMLLKEFREKVKETNLERYGVENAMSNEQIKQKMIQTKKDNGIYHTDEQRTEYKNYWLGVKRITNKHKKYLFENWDGIDFYDDENIENNFSLKSGDRLYPTIDHKISVKYGFENDISVEEIGDIKNLCITKRWINSSKNSKNTWTKYKKDF